MYSLQIDRQKHRAPELQVNVALLAHDNYVYKRRLRMYTTTVAITATVTAQTATRVPPIIATLLLSAPFPLFVVAQSPVVTVIIKAHSSQTHSTRCSYNDNKLLHDNKADVCNVLQMLCLMT